MNFIWQSGQRPVVQLAGSEKIQLRLELKPLVEVLRHITVVTADIVILVVGEAVSGRRGALRLLLLLLSVDVFFFRGDRFKSLFAFVCCVGAGRESSGAW